jgi:hypothetical protein
MMSSNAPIPQPCHVCEHPYAGTVCPICKEERPAYTAVKKMTEKHESLDLLRRCCPEPI